MMNQRPNDILDVAQEYTQKMLDQSLEHHKARLEKMPAESAEFCIDCDTTIPEARREAVKGCQRCIHCQEIIDHKNKGLARGAW